VVQRVASLRAVPAPAMLPLWCVAVCYSELQCATVCCCSVLQCVAVFGKEYYSEWCSELHHFELSLHAGSFLGGVLHCVAVCCRVMQCVAVCCSVLQRVAKSITVRGALSCISSSCSYAPDASLLVCCSIL